MPRIARVVVPGAPHHITQRGNNRQDVFFTDEDRLVYLRLLNRHAQQFGLRVHGYCLMTNHVHLVATPKTEDALAKAVGRTHYKFTRYINDFHGRGGHLWQNRFYSCVMDDAHYWTALSYVERNPVRARMHRRAWAYPWSSAAAHVGRGDPTGLLHLAAWFRRISAEEWLETLSNGEDDFIVGQLRTRTHTGRPLGSDRFLAKVETLIGRRVRPLPVGRPKGWRKQNAPKPKRKTSIKR